MVMVESGPACDIGRFRFSANRVGNQFLVAHPGRLGAAKYSRITQKAMLLNSMRRLWKILTFCSSVLVDCTGVTGSLFLSRRKSIRIMAYAIPMIPNQWKVVCQEKAAATVAPKPPMACPVYRPVM